jgi:hypothetical protein
MSVKLISYDLGKPETSSSYSDLIKGIKSLGDWAKPLESFWLVDNSLDCATIRDKLQAYLDSNDKILVIKCPLSAWASYGIANDVIQWMKTHTA